MHGSNLAAALEGSSRAGTPTAAAAAAVKGEPTPTLPLSAPLSHTGSEGGDSNAPDAVASGAASADEGSQPGSFCSGQALQRQPSADPQHLTATQQPAPRLDIRLELPAGAAAGQGQQRQGSSGSGSRRSTSACWGGNMPGTQPWSLAAVLGWARVHVRLYVPFPASWQHP